MPACKKCAKPFGAQDLLEGVCVDCIFEMGSGLKTLSKTDLEALRREKAAVEAETAGLFLSAGLLRGVLDDMLDGVEGGDDREACVTRAANDIQRLGGIGMCREMIRMSEALGDFARGMEEEARRRMGALSKLGRAGDAT